MSEQLFSSPSSGASNFKVAIRVRPKIEREIREGALECVSVELVQKAVVITRIETKRKAMTTIGIDDFTDHLRNETPNSQNFFFDLVFGPSASQLDIYNSCAKHIVMSVLEGYNGSIIAYGQTGTGKSYTIEGTSIENGIIPRAAEEIFNYIKTTASTKDQFLVRVSFLEIYNEKLTDLLDPTKEGLRIREDGSGGVYVEGLKEHIVRSTAEILKLIHDGAALRKTASTKMNVESSRSHAVFTIIVEHAVFSGGGRIVTIGKLRLVDLAGSEKLDSDAKLQQQAETRNINLSLHTFGKVVMTLTSTSSSAQQHIPYRDSKLTRILQDSLGGNCKTTLIATITPVSSCYMESLNSLQFAKRAKHVKNKAIVNKDLSQKALLSAYQDEIRRLKEQLEKQGGPHPSADEAERLEKAELEKAEVMSELVKQRRLYEKAEEEKERLLKEIEKMEKMFLHGGSNSGGEDLQKVIEEEREKILSEAEVEYKAKLAQIEEEKKRLASEREELDRQKEYIAKMRADFKPDGATEDDTKTAGSSERLFQRPVSRQSLSNSRPQPAGSSLPHPPITHANIPLARRLSQPKMGFLRPPMLPRQPFVSPYTPGPSSLYAKSMYESLRQYADALADPVSGIPCQEHQSGIRIFTGFDAAQWFTNNMEGITSIEEAVVVGQRLIELGLISEIQGGDKFIARRDAYYQFTEHGGYLVTPYSSRPSSAVSTMTLPTGYQMMSQYRTGSLPTVHTPLAWDRSSPQLTSASLTTLNTSSAAELLEQYCLSDSNPSPLHIAAITNDRQKVKDLAQVSSVDSHDFDGNTPLMYAAIAGHTKCCTLLVTQLGAKIDAVNGKGRSALMVAASYEQCSAIKALLKNGAQAGIIDCNNENVFHIAARSTSSKTLETLFKYSSDTKSAVNERNSSVQSPLHVAVIADKPFNITALLRGKADVGACDTDGRTALHYATQHRSLQCIQAIIGNCPNEVNLVDLNGLSALHLACQNANVESVNALLVSQMCDINLVDDNGLTPLHYAVLTDSPDIVTVLLNKGANPGIRDKTKMTPLQYSREKKLEECTALLLKRK